MKAINGKILIKIDTKQKWRYALTKDTVIYIEKNYNFNLREDRPSRAEVIDGKNLPKGADLLIHHNATDATYEVPNYLFLTDEERNEGYMVYSIPKDMAFAYREKDEWIPCEDFLITSRIFKPYKGLLQGIEPQKIENRLYIWKGSVEDAPSLEGKVCIVTKNSDYQIIWHNKENREESLIRTRSREIEAIDEIMLSDLKKGKYLLGISSTDCKALK